MATGRPRATSGSGSRSGPPPGGGRRQGKGRKPSRTKGTTAILVAVTASALAIGTGVAIDRLLLPGLRDERTSASGPEARPSTDVPPGPQTEPTAGTKAGTGDGATPSPSGAPAGGGTTPTAGTSSPPLKTMRAPGGSTGAPSKPGAPPASRKPQSGTPAAGSSGTEAAVVSLTNDERAKAGCKPLRVDQRLAAAARKHSADMAANNYFDHTSRNGDSPWKRMEAAGYPSPGAENIAKGYATAAAVMKGWMDSSGHRANILNCDLRAIGVGKATGSGGPLWTQDFGWE